MEWSADAIETLRGLWSEGHSTAEIGRRMGVSKNAVVGKAHRLNLPARPSPIRRETETSPLARPAAPPQRRAPTPRVPQPMRRLEQPVAPPAPVAPPVQVAPPPPVVRSFPRVSTRSCCWPLGEPGTSEFRFCGEGAIPGKPYCPTHASVAYVKARDRREDAA